MISMEERTLKAIRDLGDALRNDPRIIRLKELEERLYDDESLRPLIERKDAASDDFDRIASYRSPNHPEYVEARKRLHQAKLALDTHPLAEEYTKAYVVVREPYRIHSLLAKGEEDA